MPRFAATALGWTGGGMTPPRTPGQSHKAGRRGRSDGVDAPGGHQDVESGTVAGQALSCSHAAALRGPSGQSQDAHLSSPCQPSFLGEPTSASILVLAVYLEQEGITGALATPSGLGSSLASAVAQKAAPPPPSPRLSLPPSPRPQPARPPVPGSLPTPTKPPGLHSPPPTHSPGSLTTGATREHPPPPAPAGAVPGRAEH